MATPERNGAILLRYSAHDDGREYPPFGEVGRVSVALDVRAEAAPHISIRVDCTPEMATDDAGLYLTYAGPTPAPGSGTTSTSAPKGRMCESTGWPSVTGSLSSGFPS